MGSDSPIASALGPLRFPRPPVAPPLLAAHRGASTEAPENTIEAFALALERGADMIELDVHPTRDGLFAVVHDVSLERTTGASGLVQDLSAADIRAASPTVPLLEDVLAWARGRAYLNIDVRNYPSFRFYDTYATAERVVRAIADAGLLKNVIVQCLDHQLALAVRARSPDLVIGVTQHGRPVHPASAARDAGANFMSIDSAFATRTFVESLHAAGIGVMTSVEARLPGLPDEPDAIRRMIQTLIDSGVDVLVADDVGAAAAVIRRRESRWERDGR